MLAPGFVPLIVCVKAFVAFLRTSVPWVVDATPLVNAPVTLRLVPVAAPITGVTSIGPSLNTRLVFVNPVVPAAKERYSICVVETEEATGNPLTSLTKALSARILVNPLTVVPSTA